MYGFGRRRRVAGLGRRRHRGRGLMNFLGKANNYLKDNKLISRVATAVAPHLGESGQAIANKIASVSGSLGYGRRRRRMHRVGMGRRHRLHHLMGHGLRLAGM
jgi:hypothetical protein